MKLKLALSWLRRFANWLAGAGLAAIAVCVVAAFFGWAIFGAHGEFANRVLGVALQLLGLITTGFGIRDTRRLFGRPTLLESVRRWLRALPPFQPKSVTLTASAALGLGASGEAYVSRGSGTGSVEDRLAAIEENLKALREIVFAKAAALENKTRELKQEIQEETGQRTAEDRRIEMLMRSANTDGLWLAAVGLLWIAAGIVLATFPTELAAL